MQGDVVTWVETLIPFRCESTFQVGGSCQATVNSTIHVKAMENKGLSVTPFPMTVCFGPWLLVRSFSVVNQVWIHHF